ncbi:Hypothetical_protein [Hexamita inflata]|uniref:Hypothetical_protein n=1 Tax=Hexamita inflata TaxID=28002 RepID=A0AA86UUB3_9EUKA|nr:Hypothetical protein HINF_LOCUS52546 [Hexamita inflata]
MLSSIIVFKQISISNFNTCHNNIQLNDNKYNYCQKTSKLNNIKVQDSIIFSQKSNSVHLFIYTNYTQQSQINTNVQNFNINIFSLFGLNMNDQQIEDSILNISLEFPVRVGALLCISCDISLLNSTFVFIASGHQISALVIETQGNIKLQLSFVQFRVISNFSSGIVNTVKSSLNISIIDCKMSGSNLEQSVESGYISSFVNASISLSIQNVLICFKDTQRFGKSSISIISTGTEIALCDLCGTNNVVYGLCADSLLLGELKDGVLQCVSPFDFVDGKCVCKNGYLLNETTCVNILNAISNMSNLANNSQLLQIQQDISNININMSNLDSNLVLNFSHLQNQINTNTSNLESFIMSNFSKADLNLLQNTTVLDQRIFKNVSALNTSFQTSIINLNDSIYTLNQTIQNLNLTQIQISKMIKQQENEIQLHGLQIQCIQDEFKFTDGRCIQTLNYSVNYIDNNVMCGGVYQVTRFNIQDVTYTVNSTENYTNGFVFDSNTIIQNAFIDIADDMLQQQIFQTQSSFTYIKIQIGTQSQLNGGSIISNNDQITINQMVIMSKVGCYISVNDYLYILQQSSSQTQINSLLLNLIFQFSFSNILLIQNFNNQLNISNYQVLGNYISAKQIVLIGQVILSSDIKLTNINIMPSVYQVGNASSYLFSSVDQSVILLNNLSIMIGNKTQSQLLTNIGSSYYDFYHFGGLVVYLSKSTVTIQQVIYNCYQTMQTQNSQNFGILLGSADVDSVIILRSVCMFQMFNNTGQFQNCGVIGQSAGKLQLNQITLSFIVEAKQLMGFGLVGAIKYQSILNEIFNVLATVYVMTSSASASNNGPVSIISGYIWGKQCSIQNLNVNASSVSAHFFTSGIIGYLANANLSLNNILINGSNFSSYSFGAGSFIGTAESAQIKVENSNVSSVRIISTKNFGIIFGLKKNENVTVIISDCKSTGTNYVNNVVQVNCGFISGWTATQC